MLLYVHSCISKLVLFKDSYTFFAMSGLRCRLTTPPAALFTLQMTRQLKRRCLTGYTDKKTLPQAPSLSLLHLRAQPSQKAIRAKARARARWIAEVRTDKISQIMLMEQATGQDRGHDESGDSDSDSTISGSVVQSVA